MHPAQPKRQPDGAGRRWPGGLRPCSGPEHGSGVAQIISPKAFHYDQRTSGATGRAGAGPAACGLVPGPSMALALRGSSRQRLATIIGAPLVRRGGRALAQRPCSGIGHGSGLFGLALQTIGKKRAMSDPIRSTAPGDHSGRSGPLQGYAPSRIAHCATYVYRRSICQSNKQKANEPIPMDRAAKPTMNTIHNTPDPGSGPCLCRSRAAPGAKASAQRKTPAGWADEG